jgi:predicted acetyltransferase
VSYRVVEKASHDLAEYELRLRELRALSDDVEAVLWQFVFGVDLVTTVKAEWRPVDDPLRWRLTDPRRVRVTRFGDLLWLRPVDMVAALSSRGYSSDDTLVLDVTDEFCPWNTGRYSVDGGGSSVTTRPADLALPVDALGAAFLGGVTFTTLARAGRVEGRNAGALARADALFAAHRAPWLTTGF